MFSELQAQGYDGDQRWEKSFRTNEERRAVSQGRRVLIVDDYQDSASCMSILLTMIGNICRTAILGSEALAVAREFQPEVVILDIGLPDLSGYEVAPQLRKMIDSKFYLAAITGWGQKQDIDRTYQAGFDQHVMKPASLVKIKDIMGRAEEWFR